MTTFTLIHYTEGWQLGATVTLAAIPPLGTLVKSSGRAPDSYSELYYVDNILWADGGNNYLFVRPYEGYGQSAPLTEADRLKMAVDKNTEEVEFMANRISCML